MKTFETAIRDQIYNDNFVACDLVEIQLKNQSNVNTPLYLTNANFDVSYDSPTAPDSGANTYLATGEFISFSTVSEEFDVKVGKFAINLSCIDNDYLNKFTSTEVEGKRVVIYKAFLDYNDMTVIANPVMLFDGIIMNISINESASTCTVSIDCSTLFSDYERTNGRKTNNISNWLYQALEYDLCMEKAGTTGNTEFRWGKI